MRILLSACVHLMNTGNVVTEACTLHCPVDGVYDIIDQEGSTWNIMALDRSSHRVRRYGMKV